MRRPQRMCIAPRGALESAAALSRRRCPSLVSSRSKTMTGVVGCSGAPPPPGRRGVRRSGNPPAEARRPVAPRDAPYTLKTNGKVERNDFRPTASRSRHFWVNGGPRCRSRFPRNGPAGFTAVWGRITAADATCHSVASAPSNNVNGCGSTEGPGVKAHLGRRGPQAADPAAASSPTDTPKKAPPKRRRGMQGSL